MSEIILKHEIQDWWDQKFEEFVAQEAKLQKWNLWMCSETVLYDDLSCDQ